MEEGNGPDLIGETTGQQPERKGPIKRSHLIIIGGIIMLLIVALIFIATPLKELFLSTKTAPEISLELVTGPELEENGQYRFEVQAMVSGNPFPEVTFNRDDSLGEAGENRVVILLNPGESLILTAVARNSQGSRESYLELTVENGEENEGIIETEKLGIIEGHLVYPSSHIPAMNIIAEEVDTGLEYATDEIIYDSKYPNGAGFIIQVPPGNYHVYAIKTGDYYKAYYDEYVQSGLEVDSHEKILVTIIEGQHVDDIVVGNWWKLPPNQDPVNQDPVIDEITFPSGLLIPGETYSVKVQAGDPDGDPLSYSWEVSGSGTSDIIDPLANPMLWSPSVSGEYIIKVTVQDNRGGEDVQSETVSVVAVAELKPVAEETGFVVKNYKANSNAGIYTGDYSNDQTCRGFISFDISAISGTVQKVELLLSEPMVQGNPDFMHGTLGLWVGVVDWGSRPLELSDYNLAGTGIRSYTDYNIALTSVVGESDAKLAGEFQKNIDDGKERFQIRLHFAKEGTNNDGTLDGVAYHRDFVALTVYYYEK